MLEKLIRLSINNRGVVFMLVIALIISGAFATKNLLIDAVPDITNNQVQVITQTPNLAAQEVELFISTPLERVLANVAGQIEIRSISRFGLSVITIVFEEDIDILKARQLVKEQIDKVQNDLIAGAKPELGPLSTGLSEIYQYYIEVDSQYVDYYDLNELRSIQDWIIKKQLAGTKGLVEVSSFGGFAKQIEIQYDPFELKKYNLSIDEVRLALEKNNLNEGGGYIENNGKLYFVRSQGMFTSQEDIEQISLKNFGAKSLNIGDVATLKISSPPRYGAITANGQGEVVGGIVLMRKGENSSKVIEEVKRRVEQINKSLPAGLRVKAFLDRSELINRSITTVAINLLEGGLIVILVLFFFLGSWRASLIVASVIPLSLFFAIILMNTFGVSANLMSLGAIDFGLVVDGSVIIVEAILAGFSAIMYSKVKLTDAERLEAISNSAVGIRSSAAFGEIIIIVVYIPILTLQGVEGKMFRPMAQTVSFALLGAFLLSLTYVPAACAVFLKAEVHNSKSIPERVINWLRNGYLNILKYFLRKWILALTIVIVLLGVSIYTLIQMGGEFLPELEEGDFAIETRGPDGSGTQRMVDITKEVERILLKHPEVKAVISKIGTSEIPTDPMPIENADVIVALKDKSEWPKKVPQLDLEDKMLDSLAGLPGVRFEFQQPIQMRFNELMAGTKSDVAIRVFGSDLDKLLMNAEKIAAKIEKVEGLQSIKVEQVTGMPQITLTPNREKLARYGLSIQEVNEAIASFTIGIKVGSFYEEDRKYPIVLRGLESLRNSPESFKTLSVKNRQGEMIPLNAVCDFVMAKAPAQISHHKASRTITIGITLGNKDVETAVGEFKEILKAPGLIPAGHYYEIGGQFENLVNAKNRLLITVPLALVLIFALLYFSFKSFKQATLIFTAIPLAISGGVFSLFFRDLNFSISAAVGFIALFGIAVLNGIVMLAHFNHLKETVKNPLKRVLLGASHRFRPILVTALVAALGFFPMAFTTSAGSEVQRPLATVVIGGIFSAAILTLIIIPILYLILERISVKGKVSAVAISLIIMMMFLSNSGNTQAQSLEEVEKLALENHPIMKASESSRESALVLSKIRAELPKTQLELSYGRLQIPGLNDYTFALSQDISWPTVLKANREVLKSVLNIREAELEVNKTEVLREIRSLYAAYLVNTYQLNIARRKDSLLKEAFRVTQNQVSQGAIPKVLELQAQNRWLTAQQELNLIEQSGIGIRKSISLLIQKDFQQNELMKVVDSKAFIPLFPIAFSDTSQTNSPLIKVAQAQSKLALKSYELERKKLSPDIRVGAFNQSLEGLGNQNALMGGVAIPVFYGAQKKRAEAAKLEYKASNFQLESIGLRYQISFQDIRYKLNAKANALNEFENTVLPNAKNSYALLLLTFKAGEIDFTQFSLAADDYFQLQKQYEQTLLEYYQLQIQINYLTGK